MAQHFCLVSVTRVVHSERVIEGYTGMTHNCVWEGAIEGYTGMTHGCVSERVIEWYTGVTLHSVCVGEGNRGVDRDDK